MILPRSLTESLLSFQINIKHSILLLLQSRHQTWWEKSTCLKTWDKRSVSVDDEANKSPKHVRREETIITIINILREKEKTCRRTCNHEKESFKCINKSQRVGGLPFISQNVNCTSRVWNMALADDLQNSFKCSASADKLLMALIRRCAPVFSYYLRVPILK